MADPTVGPTITVGTALGAIAVDESVHRIYVIDQKTSALFAIDGNTNQVVGSVAVPARNSFAHGVATDPGTHRVYVTTDAGVIVVDGPSLAVITTLASGTLFYPSVAVNAATGRVFAMRPPVPGGAATPLTLFAFDANGTQAGTVALRNAGSNLGSYTPSLAADSNTGQVFVIGLDNGASGSLMAAVNGSTLGSATLVDTRPEFAGITVDPSTGRLYLVDSTASNLDVVDEADLAGAPTRVALAQSPSLGPVAIDPRAGLVYATGAGISVIDAKTNTVTTVLNVRGVVALDTISRRGYASDTGGKSVTVLLENIATSSTTTTSTPTTAPVVAAPAKSKRAPATVTTTTAAAAGVTTPTSAVTDTTEPVIGDALPVGRGSEGPSAPPPIGAITAVSSSGAPTGAPGAGLTVLGRGFPPSHCHTVIIRFGLDRVGTATPDASGSFRATDLSVPGGARRGGHQVTASCGGSAAPEAQATFLVTAASLHRTGFVTSLHLPGQVPHTARQLGISAVIAAVLVLLVAFPSELFDNTLSENYDEVRGWFAFARPLLDRLAGINRGLVAGAAVFAVAALYGLLDPGFGFSLSALAEVVGLVAALAVMTLAYGAPLIITMRRRFGERAHVAVVPAGIAIAAVCVLVSRLFHFQPGYLYGAVIGLGFSRELDRRDESVLSALSVLSMLGVSAVAWLAWTLVQHHDAGGRPGFAVLTLETMLAAVTVSGIESTVILLLPLRFMDGARVMAWDRRIWAALFGLSCFAFVDILLRPGSGYVGRSETGSQVLVVATLVAFGLGSTGFWAYFRFRRPRGEVPVAQVVRADS